MFCIILQQNCHMDPSFGHLTNFAHRRVLILWTLQFNVVLNVWEVAREDSRSNGA